MEPMQMQQVKVATFASNPPRKDPSSWASILKLLLLIFNIIFVCAGLVCLGIGIWMRVDKYIANFFTIASYNYHVSMLHAASGLFIAAGAIIIIVGVVGFMGAFLENRLLLVCFIGSLALIMCLQLSAAILAVVFRENIYHRMRNSMISNLQNHYEEGTAFGHAWDFVQVRMKCCGAQGPQDYLTSAWYLGNRRAGRETSYVPNSCCVLQYDQDRDVTRVDPIDAVPRDLNRCQRDAHGSIPTEFLHGYGCFAKIHGWVYDRTSIIMGIGFGAGIFQLIGLLSAIFYLTSVQRKNMR